MRRKRKPAYWRGVPRCDRSHIAGGAAIGGLRWGLKVSEQAASVEPPSLRGANPADVASIDSIVNALYESLSFDSDAAPDWPRFESLFARDARLVPVMGSDDPDSAGASELFDVEGFRRHIEARRREGLTSFHEFELDRRTDVFGPLAQVFSTFERNEDGAVSRGINCIQLCKSGADEMGRWRFISIAWTDERPDRPLPARYLPR